MNILIGIKNEHVIGILIGIIIGMIISNLMEIYNGMFIEI